MPRHRESCMMEVIHSLIIFGLNSGFINVSLKTVVRDEVDNYTLPRR